MRSGGNGTFVRYGVLIVVTTKISDSWGVMPYSLVDSFFFFVFSDSDSEKMTVALFSKMLVVIFQTT
jgi:hypothetical protein